MRVPSIGLAVLLGSASAVCAAELDPPAKIEAIRKLITGANYEQAESDARRLLAEVESSAGHDSLEAGQVLDVLVENLSIGFKRTDAEVRRLADRALAIKEATVGPENEETARSLANLSSIHMDAGEYDAAQLELDRQIAIRQKVLAPDAPRLSFSVGNLAKLKLLRGDVVGALALYEQVEQTMKTRLGEQHPRYALIVENLAVASVASGDLARARSLYERSLSVLEAAFDPQDERVGWCLMNYGILLMRIGDVHLAESSLERAHSLFEAKFGVDDNRTARSLIALAQPSSRRGEYDEAERMLRHALEIEERNLPADHPDLVLPLVELANVLVERGASSEARTLYERAVAILDRATPDQKAAAIVRDKLGELDQRAGDLSNAETLFRKAVEIKQGSLGPEHPEVAESLYKLAALHWTVGKVDQALEESLRAAAIIRSHLQSNARGFAEQEALTYLTKIGSRFDVPLTILSERKPEPTAKQIAEVWNAIARSRALILDEMVLRRRRALDDETPELRGLARARNAAALRVAYLIMRGPEEKHADIYLDELSAAREEKARTERALAQAAERPGADLDEHPADWAAALPKDTALVAYVRFDRVQKKPGGKTTPAYAVFWLTPDGRRHFASLGDASPIDSLVERFRDEVSHPPADVASVSQLRRTGEQLRQIVLDPLRPTLGQTRSIFVVPDGALHQLNFATLPVGTDRYLIEDDAILHYLSTERDLLHDETPTERHGMLIVGGPDFDASPEQEAVAEASATSKAPALYRGPSASCGAFSDLEFAPLPAAAAEAQEIAALWRKKAGKGENAPILSLTGPSALETRIKQEARRYEILHLATHAFFLEDGCLAPKTGEGSGVDRTDSLLLSGLALAGANRRNSNVASDQDDGILTADEIAALDLDQVRWAVLSACATGTGRVQEGEGILGLRRAFQVAGADTLIMSLWPVADHDARDWVRRLYRARFDGLSTAQSVRQASLEMIRARRKAGVSPAPFAWGAFVAAGDWK